MNKEITKTNEEMEAELNAKTGYTKPLVMPQLKFNSEEGKFYKTTGEFEEDGSKSWEEIKRASIKIHIINAARQIMSTNTMVKPKPEVVVSSGETSGYDIRLSDSQGYEVARGKYKELKVKYGLSFSKVLYIFYEDKAYKMYLGGSKLSGLFDYLKLGNPVKVETILSKGEKVKTDFGEHYPLTFKKGEDVDKEVIDTRIDDVNDYLKKVGSETLTAKPKEEAPSELAEALDNPEGDQNKVNVEEVPFG